MVTFRPVHQPWRIGHIPTLPARFARLAPGDALIISGVAATGAQIGKHHRRITRCTEGPVMKVKVTLLQGIAVTPQVAGNRLPHRTFRKSARLVPPRLKQPVGGQPVGQNPLSCRVPPHLVFPGTIEIPVVRYFMIIKNHVGGNIGQATPGRSGGTLERFHPLPLTPNFFHAREYLVLRGGRFMQLAQDLRYRRHRKSAVQPLPKIRIPRQHIGGYKLPEGQQMVRSMTAGKICHILGDALTFPNGQ